MAGTTWSKNQHEEYHLIRICWDKDHPSPWAVHQGTLTSARKIATEMRRRLGVSGKANSYPRVEIGNHTVTTNALMNWAATKGRG